MQTTPFDKRLLVICQKRELETIMQEFEDWNMAQGLEVTVVLYGTMQKSNDGFVLFALSKPLPEGVYMNLVLDPDIVDYVQYSLAPPTTETSAS
jgi:hypothetical protein